MKARVILLAILSLLMMSCMSEKDKYIREHQRFAEQFMEKNETYTATDWDAAKARYMQLREQYADHIDDMSEEERLSVDELNSKMDVVFLRHDFNNAASQFKSLINEGIGVLDELFK
jgi:outer membrane protein assembly factor BamD (BamD/ComL family)